MLDRIRQAQTEILDALAEWERTIAALYTRYAELFPDSAEFWCEMAAEENDHAEAIVELKRLLADGHLFDNIGEFRPEMIADELAEVREALDHARRYHPTPHDAVTVAMRIETSAVDSQFYRVVRCEAPEFEAVVTRLRSDSNDHLRGIQERFSELLIRRGR